MSNQSSQQNDQPKDEFVADPVKLVHGILDATKPLAKLVGFVEGAVIGIVTDDERAVQKTFKIVDELYDELKK